MCGEVEQTHPFGIFYRLENRIKEEAKSICSKYIEPPLTTDFAVMYLPIEGLYAEVIRRPALLDTLQHKYKIMVCGPTTLTALLNSLQMGFKTLAIEKRSSEIWNTLSMFKSEFTKFVDLLSKTQKKIDEASSTLDYATKKTKTDTIISEKSFIKSAVVLKSISKKTNLKIIAAMATVDAIPPIISSKLFFKSIYFVLIL